MKKLSFRNYSKQLVRILGLAAFLFVTVSCEDDPIDVDDRTQWLGAWTCNETEGDFAPQSYTVTIYEGIQLDEIDITGLYNQGNSFTIYANVYGSQLVIPNQTVDGITIEGSGSISSSGNRVEIDFVANDGAGPDDVSGYMTR